MLVRTIDAGGNAVDRGPYTVDVTTPSDRGARNGSGATDTATLTARFRGRRRPSRTVGYGDRVRIHGRLRNSAGEPIGGAELALLTTNDRPGASTFTRKRFRTEADGTLPAALAGARVAAARGRLEVARQRRELHAPSPGCGWARARPRPCARRRAARPSGSASRCAATCGSPPAASP